MNFAAKKSNFASYRDFQLSIFTVYKNFTKSLVISIASACTHSAARRVVGIIMNHRQTAVTAPMPNTEKVRSTNVIILVHLFNSVLDVSTFGKILETCFLCVKIESTKLSEWSAMYVLFSMIFMQHVKD